jgi:formyltetrahydrofolate deformylase
MESKMVKRPRSKLLRISCQDATGLVHKVTGVLYRWECNIVSNHEFVEPETGRFFMRTGFEGEADLEALRTEMADVLPEGARIDLTKAGKKRIVVLVTREPHCLGELLLRAAHKDLPAEIVAVAGSKSDLRGLSESFGVPFHLASAADRTHDEHESDIRGLLEKLSPDYVVLAKYMRILSEDFVADYAGRIVNIHHSFLPAFTGARPYRQAYKRGVKMIGATAHFVTSELDAGPIIAQDIQHIDHRFTARDMAAAGRDIEKMVLARALRWVLEERVFVSGNKTVIFD